MSPDHDADDLEDFWDAVRPGAQDLEAYWSSVRPRSEPQQGAEPIGVSRHPSSQLRGRSALQEQLQASIEAIEVEHGLESLVRGALHDLRQQPVTVMEVHRYLTDMHRRLFSLEPLPTAAQVNTALERLVASGQVVLMPSTVSSNMAASGPSMFRLSLRPWDEEAVEAAELDDDDIEDMWSTTRAGEFWYAVFEAERYVIITPADYFQRHGHLYDQHLQIDHLLPEGLDQVTEGTFEIVDDLSVSTIDNELLGRGFVRSAALSGFIRETQEP